MQRLRGFKAEAIERGIVHLGGIQTGEFITASGDEANVKVELNVLDNSYFIRALTVGGLVDLAKPYNPNLIVPMPTGADEIGQDVANIMNIDCAFLRWTHKSPEHRKLAHSTREDLEKIRHAGSIVLLDDVFRTGSTLRIAYDIPNIGEKTVAALSIWDRSDGMASEEFPVPVESIVKRYIPLRSEEI